MISYSTISGSNPVAYEFTIDPKPGSNSVFNNDDLITWIFPDGQFSHWTIETNPISSNNVVNKSNTITWTPYTSPAGGPDSIIAYVAKKGKPGNPAISFSPFIIPSIISGVPASFNMPPSATSQVNQTWEFSPNNETVLVVSYRSTCATSKIRLTYDSNQLDTVTGEIFAYQNESFIATNLQFPQKSITISNFNDNNLVNHVYIKFRLKNTLQVRDDFKINVFADNCGLSAISSEFQYLVKGNPHDPNEKLVNHSILCPSNPNQTDLNYSIKFQNDGNDFVDSVEVEDEFPPELETGIFSLGNVPDFNRVYGQFKWIKLHKRFSLAFKDLRLPGLNQTNPHNAYDQTSYEFDFNICTKTNLNPGNFLNKAEVYFYDNQNNKLQVVYTNDAEVFVDSVSGCYLASVNCTVPTVEQAGIISNLSTSPNPFSEEIQIFIELKEKTRLGVIVRDMNGRIVDKIIDSQFISGAHQLSWNGAIIPAGIYLLDVYTEHGRVTRKMIKM